MRRSHEGRTGLGSKHVLYWDAQEGRLYNLRTISYSEVKLVS